MTFGRLFRAALSAALIFALLGSVPSLSEPTVAPAALDEEALFGEALLLEDADTGEVLYSRNSKVRMYPASTTKIMTLLLALESGIDLDKVVKVPQEAAKIAEGSSVIPVKPGDKLTFRDLLYGFMLNSGNDGANAIAVLVDGSIDKFVKRMNARADQLGCEGTHFANAHGYHVENHYTTAQDLTRITFEAMKIPTFREIVAAPEWTVRILRGSKKVTEEIPSRVLMVREQEKFYYPGCTGVKTGHTNKAGYCFVGTATRDGVNLIAVTLNCPKEDQKWYDAARLFEYGFSLYEPVTMAELMRRASSEYTAVDVENAADDDAYEGQLQLTLGDVQNGEATCLVVSGSEQSLGHAIEDVRSSMKLEWTRSLVAPVKAGETLARISYEADDGTVISAELTASRDVAEQPEATPVPQASAETRPKSTTGQEQKTGENPVGETAGTPVWLYALLVALVATAAVIIALAVAEKRRRERLRRQRMARRRAAARSASGTKVKKPSREVPERS